MEIPYTVLNDDRNLIQEIQKLNKEPGDFVVVKISLPEYLDVTSLLAMERRMCEVAKLCDVKIRLVSATTNPLVEKAATRIFAGRDDIYLTVDWRGLIE